MFRFCLWLLGALLLSGSMAAGPYPRDTVDKLQDAGMEKLKTFMAARSAKSSCTLANAAQRKEWSSLNNTERTNYITAVKCLAAKPAKYSASIAPGAKSRYDDFVVTHIQQTLSIHATANFLSWHRYYTWAYEKALRDECNYTGYQPYWHWPYYASDPLKSPIFNGNATSMSGNGENKTHPAIQTTGGAIPAAGGGGCLVDGPFKDFKANLGPVSPVLTDVPKNPRADGLGYNPRCLRRDVNKNSAQYTSETYTYNLITQNKDIASFQTVMQGGPGNYVGVHSGGHFTIGGDPGGDFYNSPADPAFWLHHGMIDRTWWIWQTQDLSTRLTAIAGGTSMFGFGTRNGTLNDTVDLNVNAPALKIADLMDTLSGPFCYIYV